MSLRRTLAAAALALGLAVPALVVAQDPPEEGTGTAAEKPPEPLSLAAYLEAMQTFELREFEAANLSIQTSFIPDLHLHALALALDEAKKSGLSPEKTEEKLRAESKKQKKKEQRILVRISIEPARRNSHLFLQKKAEKHVKVDGEGKVADATEGDPAPRFDAWKIIQGASMKNYTLARCERLRFQVEVRKKGNDLCRLQLVDLLCYTETPKKSEYETKGIHIEARQISLGSIRDMSVDPISIELAPAIWKPPAPPAELAEWLVKLESEKPGSASGSK